jgi:hypothetical protein
MVPCVRWFWELGRPSAVLGERSWAWIPMGIVYPFYLLVLGVGGSSTSSRGWPSGRCDGSRKRKDPEGYAASQLRR